MKTWRFNMMNTKPHFKKRFVASIIVVLLAGLPSQAKAPEPPRVTMKPDSKPISRFYSVIDEWKKYKYSVNGSNILSSGSLPATQLISIKQIY